MSTEPRTALERIREADRALGRAEIDAGADARIRARLADTGAARRRWPVRWALLAGAMMMAAAALFIFGPRPGDRMPACPDGPAPDRCVVSWAGSRIIVEPGGRIARAPHGVTLHRGRARFAVQPRAAGDPPYRVRVAAALIEVIGTAFTVTADINGGAVELHHGRIAVDVPDAERRVVETPGQTLRWSRTVTPAPTARAPDAGAADPPNRPSTAPEPSPLARPTPTPDAARPRRVPKPPAPPPASPVTDAELARVATLRRDGQPRAALTLVERLIQRPNTPPVAEALSVERGDLLGGPLGERAAACAHWRRHIEQHPAGRLRSAVDASVIRLRCPAP